MADLDLRLRGRLGESLDRIFLFAFAAAFSAPGLYAGVSEVAEALGIDSA